MTAPRVTMEADAPVGAPSDGRLVVGQVFGRYRIDAILGSGGMGTVARARDLDLDRDVAFKIVALADAEGARRRAERLLREAQTMAKLRAPNVRAVHDVGSAGGIDYLAMEYIAGTDLSGWLATPRSDRDIARVFADAGTGLVVAHAAGIVHRDIKPSNILVGDDGVVVVTDFGLSRWTHEHVGDRSGTPGYMAPDRELDACSDQYSFGVALAEAVPAATHTSRLAVALRTIARRGSSESRDARFPSMLAVVEAIRDAARPRRRWPYLAVAALTVAGVGAIVAWPGTTARQPDPEPDPIDDPGIARVHDLLEHGFLVSARSEAQKLVDTIRPALRPAAMTELGWVALYQDDTAFARTTLGDASRLADAARDDRTRARADIGLLMAATARGSDLAAIARAEDVAVASSSRVQLDRRWRALLRYMQANAAIARGDVSRGRSELAEARALVEPPDVAGLVTWAEIARTQVRFAPAERIAMLEQLVTVASAVAGASHMAAISGRGELAMAYEDAGRLDDAARTMAELRRAGATPEGQHLLAEIDPEPAVASHAMTIAVTSRDGTTPIVGATVVAASQLRGNARYLVGALPLYAEHQRHLVTATTDRSGTATVRVPDTGVMWIAAEDDAHGRSRPLRVEPAGTHAELALQPWGHLAGAASDRVHVYAESPTSGPDLVADTDARGNVAIDRLAYGAYLVTSCTRGPSQTCRAARVEVGPSTPALELRMPGQTAMLDVRVTDELHRPIESSFVAVVPADYAPANLDAFQRDWASELASRRGSLAAWSEAHGTRAARLVVAPGRARLCASAVHGDTEDPSFVGKLDALAIPVPMFCEPLELRTGSTDTTLVVPASSRVWLR